MSTKLVRAISSDDNLIRIAAWTRDGLTEAQIAEKLGVHPNTFSRAKKDKDCGPKIIEALCKTKDVVDMEVENMLLKRAKGYEYEEVKEEWEMGILVKRTITKKTVAPDTAAQIFWLKNRKQETWRDRREVDNTIALDKLDDVLGQIKGVE